MLEKYVSRKFLLTFGVIVLCAVWMFGGEEAQTALKDAPNQLQSFIDLINEMIPLLTIGLAAFGYNLSQGKVDVAKEEATGRVEAAKVYNEKNISLQPDSAEVVDTKSEDK